MRQRATLKLTLERTPADASPEQSMRSPSLIFWIISSIWIRRQASSNQVADAYTAIAPTAKLTAGGAVTHSSFRWPDFTDMALHSVRIVDDLGHQSTQRL